MYASWAISNGGVVVMIGRRLWWLKFDRAGAEALSPKQSIHIDHDNERDSVVFYAFGAESFIPSSESVLAKINCSVPDRTNVSAMLVGMRSNLPMSMSKLPMS